MQPAHGVPIEAGFFEFRDAVCHTAAAAQRADIEGLRRQRVFERFVIVLQIVRGGDDRGPGIEAELRHRFDRRGGQVA